MKTKSIKNIEQKMQALNTDTLRYQILEHTKQFKTSWVNLGQALYSVWKDKLYKNWDFSTFDGYTTKEIGIRKQTALKLLKSYYFLEKEEPQYISSNYAKEADAALMPTYESVDLLRQASNRKELDQDDLRRIKNVVLQKGKDAREVKKDLTQIIKERQELEPEQAREKKKSAQLKRLVSVLKTLQKEIKMSKTLPIQTIKDIDKLIEKLEIGTS